MVIARPGLAAAAEAQDFDWLCEQVAELLDAAAQLISWLVIWMMRRCGLRLMPFVVDDLCHAPRVQVRADLLALRRDRPCASMGPVRGVAHGAVALAALQPLVEGRV